MSDVTDIIYKRVDGPGLVNDTLDEVLEKALMELVQSTENPWDDALAAALYPPLEAILKDQVRKYWDGLLKPKAKLPEA